MAPARSGRPRRNNARMMRFLLDERTQTRQDDIDGVEAPARRREVHVKEGQTRGWGSVAPAKLINLLGHAKIGSVEALGTPRARAIHLRLRGPETPLCPASAALFPGLESGLVRALRQYNIDETRGALISLSGGGDLDKCITMQ